MPDRLFRNCKEDGCTERTNHATGLCPAHQREGKFVERKREYDRKRSESPHRRLYGLALWKSPRWGLRALKLKMTPMCEALVFGEPCRNGATTVHHKIDHKGDMKLFTDMNNLMSLCKSCHDALREQEMKTL